MNKRTSGILLHITSLPSPHGIGDFGPSSYEFVDFLKKSKQTYWQVLPLNPTEQTYGNSPYSSPSSFAGNPLLISPELLRKDGYLSKSDLHDPPLFPKDSVDFELALSHKTDLLKTAFESNLRGIAKYSDFRKFCLENKHWLDDYCLYTSIKSEANFETWQDFPTDLRNRKRQSLDDWYEKEEHFILYNKFLQYIFFKQWDSLKKYSNDNGIKIIGDIPYYVNYDSSDVWANQEIFKLDDKKNPEFIAGVPPDYFSKTGQLWGNPVYNWDKLKETQYSWWIKRIGHNLSMFDKLRLDHFRGFVSYWEVNAGETTALNGKWVNIDAESFFNNLFSCFDKNKFIAEDLGLITEDVKEIIKYYELPGMKILLFAFGDDYPYGDYLPTNIGNQCVIYTGTHDNNTALGWWNEEAGNIEKNRVSEYLEKELNENNINWELIELAMKSRADTLIIPMQDILGLGASARMNTPSTTTGNWAWRMESMDFLTEHIEKLKVLSEYNDRG
jgi:4-alpha-glucanotransferase